MNAKTAKLLRRLAGLVPPRDRGRQLDHLKARWNGCPRKTRGRLRASMREAVRQELARRAKASP